MFTIICHAFNYEYVHIAPQKYDPRKLELMLAERFRNFLHCLD